MKKGFTLAEVLITLGIIGVVAAITMPTLIQNYQKQVLVNQFKKTYATLSEGMKRLVADEGCTNLECTSLCNSNSSAFTLFNDRIYECELNLSDENVRNKIINIFQLNNIDFVDHENYSDFSGFLADGSQIEFTRTSNGVLIWIDVNGLKGPNKDGRDQFFLKYGDKNFSFLLGPHPLYNGDGCPTLEPKYSCPARLISNGWKMDY